MAALTLDAMKKFLAALTILVVDDSPFIRNLLKKLLEHMGAGRVMEASDGEMAWTLITAEKVGLVISDWKMPKKSGLELLEMVRAGKATRELPFIIMSAEAEKDMVLQSIKLQVTDVLIKPMDEKKLIKSLIKVVK